MVLGLAAMPLCALVAVVLLTFQKYHSDAVNTLAMNQGLVVLPFVLLTSIVLLFAVLILADHQRLERANQLSGLREVYYQGLRQQESQVRQLRHDLRNHLTVIQGLLEKSDPQGAIDYLEQMAGSPALQGRRRFCDNETANVVLSSKAETMERMGIEMDFAVSLPRDLSVADNFRNREYYPLLKKLKIKKVPSFHPAHLCHPGYQRGLISRNDSSNPGPFRLLHNG